MKKYLYILKATIMANLQYVGNVAYGVITYAVIVLILINLWDYIYVDKNALIHGYTYNQIVWYLVITEFMWFVTRNKVLIRNVTEDIRSGKIAYKLNKPYHYIGYVLGEYFGEIVANLSIFSGALIVLGLVLIGPLITFKLWTIPIVIFVIMIAILINALVRLCISLTAFWLEEVAPFHWLYDKLLLVIGILFPIEMLPAVWQPIVRWSPIYVVTYGPAKLIVDFSWLVLVKVLSLQIIYLGLTVVLINYIYKKGVQKVSVHGG